MAGEGEWKEDARTFTAEVTKGSCKVGVVAGSSCSKQNLWRGHGYAQQQSQDMAENEELQGAGGQDG